LVVKTRISAAEFGRTAARRGPCELIRGEVVALSPGSFSHSAISANVAILLGTWARKKRSGRVLTNEAGIVTERKPDTVRGADVAYFSFKRLPRSETPAGFAITAPELVVEIVGKGQGWRQMVEKAAEYLRMGVGCVWVLDPKTKRLHVFRPDDEPQILEAAATASDAKLLPGFRCRVRDFFA